MLRYFLLWMITLLPLAAGCSSPAEELADVRASALDAHAEAEAAFEAGDYATAAEKYSLAIDRGGLHPDVYSTAAVKRAVAWAATGKEADAMAELDRLEPGAPNPAEVLAARSFVLKKQGKAAEARAAFAKAKRMNPLATEFE